MNKRLSTVLAACLVACAEGQLADLDDGSESEAEIVCLDDLQPSVETCDGIDNDCDGEVDEDFNFQRDPNHCGGCNISCHLANAESACQDHECRLVACHDGFWDVNQNPLDGCEYACTPMPIGEERCDEVLVDEDCDGLHNEGCVCLDGDTQPCGTDVGVCAYGEQRCVRGEWEQRCIAGVDPQTGECRGTWSDVCVGGVLPVVEDCDGLDNDCDGTVDERNPWNINDPQNCGGCGHVCAFDHATPWCEGYVCRLGVCDDGFRNVNRAETDGCEYACTPTGEEQCDGLDNDCNGQVDDHCCEVGSDRLCGTDVGVCEFGREACLGGRRWDACEGGTAPSLEVCDGLDNDCDDVTDEPSEADVVFCDGQGWGGVCDLFPRAVTCELGEDGHWQSWCRFIPDERFGDEQCDGLDNDCDGEVDEGFVVGACYVGDGACRVFGQWACQVDGTNACSDRAGRPLEPWLPASDEDCGWTRLGNGLDDDCDGETDEGCGPPEVMIACTDNGENLTVVVDGDISRLIVWESPPGTETIVTVELGMTADQCWESGAPECPHVIPYAGDDVEHVFERVPYTWFTPRIRTDVGTVGWLDLSLRQVRASGNCEIVSGSTGTFVNGHAS